MCASDKNEFMKFYERFLSPEHTEKPMLFEVFTDSEEESKALEVITSIEISNNLKAKDFAKKILGKKGIDFMKKVVKR